MNIFTKLFNKTVEYKESEARKIILNYSPEVIHPQRDYKGFSEEGYKKNVIAFRCVNLISDAISGLPVNLYKKKLNGKLDEIEMHPVINLLEQPNPLQTKEDLIKSFVSFYLLAGNAYLEGVGNQSRVGIPKELWTHRSDRWSIKAGGAGVPMAYIYKVGHRKKEFQVNPVTGRSPIMHWKTFNPLDDFYGMSFLESAAFSVDQLNKGNEWNLAMLQNSARPSGAFIYKSDVGGQQFLNDNQRQTLKKEIDIMYSGSANTGRPMLLEGGLDYREMSLSPKDMEFLENKHTTSRDIAIAFNVPPQLVGIPGDSTYANYEQARLAFYIDTVLPMAKNLYRYLTKFLLSNEVGMCFGVDEDEVEALAPIREKKWQRAQNASWLSINEKRQLTGYGDYESTENPADMLFIPMGQTPLDYASEPIDNTPLEDTEDVEVDRANDEDEVNQEEDTEELEDDVSDEEDEEKLYSVQPFIEGKQFNLSSNRARRSFWLRQNRKLQRYTKVFQRDVRRAFLKEAQYVLDEIKGLDEPRLIEIVTLDAMERSRKNFEEAFKNNYSNIMSNFGGEVLSIGKSVAPVIETKDKQTRFDQYVQLYIERIAFSKVQNIQKVTQKRLRKTIRNLFDDVENVPNSDDIAKAVSSTYTGFSKTRSATIARTETHNASMNASLQAAKELQLPTLKKVWISDQSSTARGMDSGDSTSHIAMNGESVEVDEKFIVPSVDGNDEMDGPGDPSAPADQVINCKCVLAYETR